MQSDKNNNLYRILARDIALNTLRVNNFNTFVVDEIIALVNL